MVKSIDARSYYVETANVQLACENLKGEISADVCVIGAGYTGLSAALELGGSGSVKEMFDAIAFQTDRGAQLSFWVVTGAPTVQVIVQAAALALAAASAAAVWVFRDLGESLVRVCALAAAVMLAFQIGASYWSYAYVPWVYPLLAVALLWPRPEPAAQEQAESPRTITS